MNEYTVYVRVDDAGRVTGINSSAFLTDTEGWVAIDKGHGDSFHHAQGNYLHGPLTDARGVYRYRLDGDVITERTQEEMDGDWTEPDPQPSYDERLSDLEEALDLLLTGVTE